jgi:AcrR family transcriptional regulator
MPGSRRASPAGAPPAGLDAERERILDAMLGLVIARGYDATGIEAIVERAGVDRGDFDRRFDGKEDCALAVFARTMERIHGAVRKAYDTQEDWPDSLRAAAYATADYIAEHPDEARFGAVELLSAGELAQASREAGFRMSIDLVDAGRLGLDDPDSVPPHTAERVIGSFAVMVTQRMQDGSVDPYEFVPQLMYLAVLPYRGPRAAARELELPRPQPSPEPGRGEGG